MFPFNSFLIHTAGSIADQLGLLAQGVAEPANMPIDEFGSFGQWTLAMTVPIVLGAIGYLLLQYAVLKSQTLTYAGIASVGLALIVSFGFTQGSLDVYLFQGFAALAIGGGVGFVVAREPVYAALGFATAVLSTCGILFMQSALFIAAATMIVYAGATIIIFLFVLMFAQQKDLRTYDIQLNHPWLAAVVGVILLGTITLCVTSDNAFMSPRVDKTRLYSLASSDRVTVEESRKTPVQDSKSVVQVNRQPDVPDKTAGLGRSLYTDYLLAVELAGTVLLVATIGAIALAARTIDVPPAPGRSS